MRMRVRVRESAKWKNSDAMYVAQEASDALDDVRGAPIGAAPAKRCRDESDEPAVTKKKLQTGGTIGSTGGQRNLGGNGGNDLGAGRSLSRLEALRARVRSKEAARKAAEDGEADAPQPAAKKLKSSGDDKEDCAGGRWVSGSTTHEGAGPAD